MAKRYNEPIQLKLSPAREPESFIWRGRRYQINGVIRRWKMNGNWWEQQSQRFFALISATRLGNSGQYEIFYEFGRHQWYLRSIYD